eukprot:1617035-Prymnesium_polylepis.1
MGQPGTAVKPAKPRKTRTPKVVAKGLEAAFRKRMNGKLREAKGEVRHTLTLPSPSHPSPSHTISCRQACRHAVRHT